MEREFSVNFGAYNTWDDWHLIPADRPVILPPTEKTHDIDIPGGNGILDASTALTGYPLFNNREGSWDFYIENGYDSFVAVYRQVMHVLQGKKLKISLEEDKDHFYDGKCWVTNQKQSEGHSMLTLNYSVYPYKHRFNDVGKVSNYKIETTRTVVDMDVDSFTDEPVCPKFIVDPATYGDSMTVKFQTSSITYTTELKKGTWMDPMIMYIPGEHAVLTVTGTGTFGIQAAGGWL